MVKVALLVRVEAKAGKDRWRSSCKTRSPPRFQLNGLTGVMNRRVVRSCLK